jgi:hypothetical protein
VTENLNTLLEAPLISDGPLLSEFSQLWAEADQLWNLYQDTAPFAEYVSADYLSVYESLARLRGSATSVLEWGSGLGVVTIMASRMGFQAYGIEAEPGLIEHAAQLAASYGATARFARGSFIPDHFVGCRADGERYRTVVEVAEGYTELDMDLRDFDLVYAYPWPDEHTFYRNIMRQFARSGAMLLTYDARAGMELVRCGV